MELKKVAIIVSRGSFNNLIQVSTLLRALTAGLDVSIRVLFRDEALYKLTRARIGEINFSEDLKGGAEEFLGRLKTADFVDLESFLKDSKEHGMDVKFYACTSTMYVYGIDREDLSPLLDDPRSLTTFLLEDVSEADSLMTF